MQFWSATLTDNIDTWFWIMILIFELIIKFGEYFEPRSFLPTQYKSTTLALSSIHNFDPKLYPQLWPITFSHKFNEQLLDITLIHNFEPQLWPTTFSHMLNHQLLAITLIHNFDP